MATSTIEDYIKRVFLLQQELGVDVVPMGKLSEAMAITPGTTTTMVKAMADSKLVTYRPRVGVALTDKGRALAVGVLRRHRIAEAFLVQVLGMDWSEVHEDAERLEHAISDRLLERMDRMLNSPTHDPHGDPIPALNGNMAKSSRNNIASAEPGKPVKVSRIIDQSPEFLSYVSRVGMAPGAKLRIEGRDPMADSVVIRLANGRQLALSTRVALKIVVS